MNRTITEHILDLLSITDNISMNRTTCTSGCHRDKILLMNPFSRVEPTIWSEGQFSDYLGRTNNKNGLYIEPNSYNLFSCALGICSPFSFTAQWTKSTTCCKMESIRMLQDNCGRLQANMKIFHHFHTSRVNRSDREKNRRGVRDYAQVYTKMSLCSTYQVSWSSHPLLLSMSRKRHPQSGERRTNLRNKKFPLASSHCRNTKT
jgi:hypothetical protein